MNKKKKTIITSILSALAGISSPYCRIFYVKQQHEQAISEKIAAISDANGFQSAERSNKLTLLQQLKKELEYKASEDPDGERLSPNMKVRLLR